MKVLVTGGAGYIGSCTANNLLDLGHEVTIIDNLSSGNKNLVPKKAKFYKYSIQDKKKINNLLSNNQFDIIFHFAAYIDVNESTAYPKKYFQNNYVNSKIFFLCCKKHNIKNVIFSSTAAVYGNSSSKYVRESSLTRPTNPYAKSKLKVEQFLKNSNFFNYIILRYFNVAGSDILLRSGQNSKNKSTHLIKKLCEASLSSIKNIEIYGDNYPSKDGTAIRDYIHVMDLADIHIKCAKYLLINKKSHIFNCGYGNGTSVKKVISCFNKISKNKVRYLISKRRAGDVFCLVANTIKIQKYLKWKPAFNSITKILISHLEWERKINKTL